MFNTNPKKNDNKKTGKIDQTKIPKGHMPHQSGSGKHRNKKDKRNGNRSEQVDRHMKDYQ